MGAGESSGEHKAKHLSSYESDPQSGRVDRVHCVPCTDLKKDNAQDGKHHFPKRHNMGQILYEQLGYLLLIRFFILSHTHIPQARGEKRPTKAYFD